MHATRRDSLKAARHLTAALAWLCLAGSFAVAQVNGQGQRPYLGWSSWSQEVTHSESWLTEAQIKSQSDALKASGLQAHGYLYINIDSGWQSGFDANGLPMVNTARFPDGMAATVQYIHNNGQKAGIYWIPGIQQPVYDANGLIFGTPYRIDSIVLPNTPGNAFSAGQANPWHKKIDFSQPGAQAYVNSVVALFASWGFDLIKLDGVTPGSDHNDLSIDNRGDVQAWSQAIAQSGRPIWLTVSWALDHNYIDTWQSQANARRIEDDIDCRCGTLTNWTVVSRRFNDLPLWQNDAGPTKGWNDLDSLEIGSASQDGLTLDERQSAMTLWAIANAPLYLGDDLTQLDSAGLSLLSNDSVIAVNQSGVPGVQVQGGNAPVWTAALGSGNYYAALFNLGASPASVTLNWPSLGLSSPAAVHDLWNNTDLGVFNGSYSTVLNPHASQLVKITATAPPPFSITASPTALTLAASGAATSQLTVTPAGSTATLSFACANLPASLHCSFTPATLALAGATGPQTVTLAVSRTTTSALLRQRGNLLLITALLFLPWAIKHRAATGVFLPGLLLVAATTLSGCGASRPGSTSTLSSSLYAFNVNISTGSTIVQTISYSVLVQ